MLLKAYLNNFQIGCIFFFRDSKKKVGSLSHAVFEAFSDEYLESVNLDEKSDRKVVNVFADGLTVT